MLAQIHGIDESIGIPHVANSRGRSNIVLGDAEDQDDTDLDIVVQK